MKWLLWIIVEIVLIILIITLIGALLPRDHVGDIEAERGDVLPDVRLGFLERHQHARLSVFDGATDQEFRGHAEP